MDIREWIRKLEAEGQFKRVKKEVDWDGEIAGILRRNFSKGRPANG